MKVGIHYVVESDSRGRFKPGEKLLLRPNPALTLLLTSNSKKTPYIHTTIDSLNSVLEGLEFKLDVKWAQETINQIQKDYGL